MIVTRTMRSLRMTTTMSRRPKMKRRTVGNLKCWTEDHMIMFMS